LTTLKLRNGNIGIITIVIKNEMVVGLLTFIVIDKELIV